MTRIQPRRVRLVFVAALILLFICGCGQKGDLFLPDKAATRYTAAPSG